MTNAFKALSKSIIWVVEAAGASAEWKALAEAFRAACDAWWRSLHDLPCDADVRDVVNQLGAVTSLHCAVLEAPTAPSDSEVSRRAVPTPPRPSTAAGSTLIARPELPRKAPTVPADSEVDRRAVPSTRRSGPQPTPTSVVTPTSIRSSRGPADDATPVPGPQPTHVSVLTPPSISVLTPPSFHRAHDGGAPALTPSVAWPTTDSPTSEADCADAQSAQAVIAALTQPDNFGCRAATSLCAAAIGHLQHMRSTNRHGKPTANSIPLATRIASGDENHRQLVYGREAGDDIGFLFRVILGSIT